ncbi:hypothetical protein HN51_055323, partial [Arachis hypogaea]
MTSFSCAPTRQQIKLKLLFSSSQVSSSTPAPPAAASIPTTAAPLSLSFYPHSVLARISSQHRSHHLLQSMLPDEVLERVIGMLKSRKDRSSVSLVCKKWYNAERWSRRNVFIGNCYSVSPEILTRRFPNIRSVTLKEKPRFSDFNLVPANWGADIHFWLVVFAEKYHFLEELRLKRMTVTDESLKFLVRSFPNFKAISLQNCDGFSTDGLAAIAADCKNLMAHACRRDVAFASYEVTTQMDVSAKNMIFGMAGIDPERRPKLIKMRVFNQDLERTASQQEIKKAYYKLALRLHPDKNPGDEGGATLISKDSIEAKAKFQQLQNVISILGDEEKQAIYDQIGCVDDAVSDLARDVVQNLHNYFKTMYKKVVCVDLDFVLISCRTVLICIYKVTEADIEEFEANYRGSDSEKNDLIDLYKKCRNKAVSLEGLSPRVPLYKVTEGNEPCFFTTYFPWDHAKASVQGNSFQKKVTLLFGIRHAIEPQDRLNGLNQGRLRQRAEALAALNSAFKSSSGTKSSSSKTTGRSQGSQRAAAVAALSQVLTAEKKKQSPDSSPVTTRSP